jgi:Zn-dependent oligopeptidase
VENAEILHPSVTYYRVSEGGKTIAFLYMDLFPREAKRGGHGRIR